MKSRMQKISTHLWFDKEAKEAAEFYASVFPGSKVTSTSTIHGTPSGDVEIVNIDLWRQEFTLISAGPLFKFNPSISFLVAIRDKEDFDPFWEKLSTGGKILMDAGAYPFSERYGWTQDKYGLSWQVMYYGERPITQPITPTLIFTGVMAGKAESAINFYASIFKNAKVGNIMRYGKDAQPDPEGTVAHGSFTLEGQEFAAMDSAREHGFTFNEAISLVIHCETQEEIDYYWGKLSADPKAEQCGWLKDTYGVSWQIVPTIMEEMMRENDAAKLARVTEAFLKMKKFDIAELKRAAEGF